MDKAMPMSGHLKEGMLGLEVMLGEMEHVQIRHTSVSFISSYIQKMISLHTPTSQKSVSVISSYERTVISLHTTTSQNSVSVISSYIRTVIHFTLLPLKIVFWAGRPPCSKPMMVLQKSLLACSLPTETRTQYGRA